MADLDFEQLDRGAVQYLRSHLDPSFIKEYDDDEIFLYVMDLCDDYTETQGDDEEVCLDLDAMAAYVSDHLSQDMGVRCTRTMRTISSLRSTTTMPRRGWSMS